MPAEQQQRYPLSAQQKGIWYTEKFHSGTSIAGISATKRLKMPIDFSLLEKAINLVIENNDSMRINVCMADNEPRQYVAPHRYRNFEIKDFTSMGEGDLFAWNMMMTRTPLFAENADLFRIVLLKIDDNTCGYFVMLHHLISDAWSMVMLGDEVMRYYLELEKGLTDQTQKPSYLDYLEDEAAYFNTERFEKDALFWRNQFESLPELVGIKTRKYTEISSAAARRSYVLPRKLSDKIHGYTASSGNSAFVTFMSAFFLYLNRITGCEDAVIGVPVYGRFNAKMKRTMGMFVSTVPFRITVDCEDSYSEFVQGFNRQWTGVLRHQRCHIDDILRDVRNRFGDVDRLYDIVFSYQNAKFEQTENSANLNSQWHFNGHQNESLIININERDDDGNIMIDYDYLTGLFHAEDIDALHDHYIRMLWHSLDSPKKQIKKIEMVSEKEKTLILNKFNDTTTVFPDDRTMLDFFEERAARNPDDIAILFGDAELTYRVLNDRANALARVLLSKGVTRGSIVAMMLRRSFEMMTGILAIWKAGGAYLPIDPDYPEDRIAYMFDDGGARILLTASSVGKQTAFTGEILEIDRDLPDSDECTGVAATPGDVAYVIYTSGSTGQAKGVMVEHRALVNRIHWMNRKYPISKDDVILQKTTYTFDVSVWELVWWFFSGAKMVFLEPEAEKLPDRLIDAIALYKVTTLHFVPSMLNAFLGFVELYYDPVRLCSLKKVFTSGEALTPQQVNRFNTSIGSVSGARLYNLYGPTEAAIDVTFYDCPIEPNQRVVPIGKPIDNIQLYVTDRYMNLQPIGVPGELCIGGVGLARGYLNKPELTAEKFVDNPFSPGTRLYKTGDLVRWFPKGDIEYLGRIDRQIKIRGFRIELGDIQHHLEHAPSVRETAVVCFDGQSGNKYLAAYYVADIEISAASLHAFLARRLPEYMIPSHFIRVERIPLFSNGKANVALLPAPITALSAISSRKIIAPRNKTEAFISRIWSETLGIDELSVTDNFFKMGGDSLSAIDMVCRMPKPVNVSKLYGHPTLEDFARNYEEKSDTSILTLLTGKEDAKRSYILCPYGGGGAYSYMDLAGSLFALDPVCSVYSVNLPGHDYGAASGNFLSIHDVAALILKETAQRVSGRIVVYAHCVGVALGVELIRLFKLAGDDVEALFIGGILPPAHVAAYGWFFDPWMFVGDERLIKFLNSLGFSAESLGPEEMQMLVKAFRYDVRSYYRYFARFSKEKQNKFSVPVFSILGEIDRMTQRQEGSRNWSYISDAPATTIKISAANHYFTKTHARELAGIVDQSLKTR